MADPYKEDVEPAQRRVEAWWHGQIVDRAVVQAAAPRPGAVAQTADAGDSRSQEQLQSYFMDPEIVIPRLTLRLRRTWFGGEAFPVMFPVSIGMVAILANYLGCPLRFVGTETTWHDPVIQDWDHAPSFQYDPDHPLWRGSRALLQAAVDRSDGYFVGCPDLNGPTQALGLMRDNERLALDFYDHPDRIKPALAKINQAWYRYWRECAAITQGTGGNFYWMGFWSEKTSIDLQSDFSCMLSVEQFNEYFLPFIEEQTRLADRTMYHLDGPGAIRHADALLALPRLTGIQWIQGAGGGPVLQYLPLLKKIQDAGKLVSFFCEKKELERIFEELSPEGMFPIVTDCESPYESQEVVRRVERLSARGHARPARHGGNGRGQIPPAEGDVLRGLAERKARSASTALNQGRREDWYRHNALQGTRPMILAEIQGVMDETVPDSALVCAHPVARRLERSLRHDLYLHEAVRDDFVMEPWIDIPWKVAATPYVPESELSIHVPKRDDGKIGARRWDPPIRDISRDFGKLRKREFSVDREGTLAEKADLEAVFEGILPVRIRGAYWWTFGMTWTIIDLIGLESLMLFMYDDPEGLHRLMRFVHDDHVDFAAWLEENGLLNLNNENDYIGSGSRGHVRELPGPGLPPQQAGSPSRPARSKDLWLLLESQETVGVGPEQFEQFVFPYQLDLAVRFGLVYYGCCEPVHSRWKVIQKIPNLRSVSVSPWADEAFMAEALHGKYVYSRKPNPAHVSTSIFDETAIRADIRHTFEVARGCDIEIVMKDVHTLNGHPERLGRWVQIAREESDRVFGS